MTNGDIIDVTSKDEEGRRTIRRVRVTELAVVQSGYRIIGVNMQSAYPKKYRLPSQPGVAVNGSSWKPFDDSGEVDE